MYLHLAQLKSQKEFLDKARIHKERILVRWFSENAYIVYNVFRQNLAQPQHIFSTFLILGHFSAPIFL